MRLLQKNEIDKKRAEENRQRMEEGLQVAERVDTLRETLASEEFAFEKYRTDRLKAIQEEIDTKQKEKYRLDALVVQAQKEYDLLRVPLDSEWESLKEEQQQLAEDLMFLNTKSAEIEEFDVQNNKDRNLLYLEGLKLEDMKKEMSEKTEKNLNLSEDKRDEADVLLNEANKKVEKIERTLKRKEKEIRDREYDISVREHELTMQENGLEEEKNKVQEEWIKIHDQRGVLERAFNRLKK